MYIQFGVLGKQIRYSFDKKNDKYCLHMVNAWMASQSLVLEQVKADEKSNEIIAIPQILHLLLGVAES